jgi:Fic-DOC domain mobile mystery protein B
VAIDDPEPEVEPAGATPLDEGERRQLKPAHITSRGELNEWEQANIAAAYEWALAPARGRRPALLSDAYVRRLHKKMFDRTWKWAGAYRTTERNIGIPAWQIAEQVRILCDNTRYQIESTAIDPDRLAAEFHHRLVQIHPFPNGNGRHARLMTDVLFRSLERDPFTWGRANLETMGDARDRYLQALRAADRGDIQPLLRFCRS